MTVALMKAAIGTEKTAPAMPAIADPAVITSMTATGCRDTAFDIIKGCKMLDSICWTTRMMISMMIAFDRPPFSAATITAMTPEVKAPRIGTNAAKNVITPIGMARGTPRKNAPSAMPTASMAATWICVRT